MLYFLNFIFSIFNLISNIFLIFFVSTTHKHKTIEKKL